MADISLAYLDQPLNNVSLGYRNADFVAPRILPFVPVTDRSGRYWVFGFEKFREYDTARAPGAEAREVAPWSLSNNPFFCDGHALKDYITDEARKSAAPGAQIEVTTVENLMQGILLKFEIKLAALITNTSVPQPPVAVPSTTLSGTSQWSDYTNSDPIAAIEAQRIVIEQAVSEMANTLVVSYPVHLKLRQHPKIIDRFKYTTLPAGFPTEQQLASVFEVDNYIVARAKYQPNAEGQTPASALSYVWGKNALLCYVPSAPGLRVVSLGYTFRWLFGAPELGGVLTKRYRVEWRTADVIEVQTYYDPQLIAPLAGYLWINAVA
jgi:hypothetical protein